MQQQILIVDDDALSCELLLEFLEAAGYSAVAVASAEESLQLVAKQPPALILMDLRLPGLDGLEATRILKKVPSICHIPVVATTAHAMKGDEDRIYAAGCDAYLAKPIDLSRLLTVVDSFLNSSQTNAGPQINVITVIQAQISK